MKSLIEYEKELAILGSLHTPQLCLRAFTEKDAEDMYEYASDPEVTKYLTWLPHETLEVSRENIKKYFSKVGAYAIELCSEKKVIGGIDLRIIPEHKKGSFGYVLNRKFWNRSYMTEALDKILEIAFRQLDLNRIEATHYVGNEGSGRVMEKCGMKYEGTFSQELIVLGRYVDVVHYAILKEEYLKNQIYKDI